MDQHENELNTQYPADSPASRWSVLDCVPHPVLLADAEGAVTFANRIWSEKIGIGTGDIKGDGWTKALHPDDAERVTATWRDAAKLKDNVEIELRLLQHDGGYCNYRAHARKTGGDTDNPPVWVVVCSDVTDARRNEQELRLANQELAAYSSTLSHDLRAPLRSILGFGERLQLESAGRLEGRSLDYLQRILAGAARMNELIDGLVSLSKVARADMVVGSVDLSKLSRQVFEELRQKEPERVVEIVIRDGMTANGDANLLRVVMVNLIGNALKFSVTQDSCRIEIGETAEPGNTSMFYVCDNGAGFDPSYAGKLFGIFQRLHSNKEFPGTGVGLAVVKSIIHRHGGRVSAEGTIGQGAKVCFWLRRT